MLIAIATLLQLRPIHPLFGVEVANVDPDGNVIPGDDKRMVYHSGNQLWHTDSSFKRVPALASLLSGRECPPEGGETGDLVMWDNRCTLHRGRAWDYARHRRVMHRTTVAGEGPTV